MESWKFEGAMVMYRPKSLRKSASFMSIIAYCFSVQILSGLRVLQNQLRADLEEEALVVAAALGGDNQVPEGIRQMISARTS